jgi:hypothetical protein
MAIRMKRQQLLWKTCASIAQQRQFAGDFAAAENQYKLSLLLARHARGSHHEDVGEALINLADFFASVGRFADAERHYREALVVYERAFGPDNLVLAMIYRVLAELFLTQRRTTEARLLQARCSAILHKKAS